MQKLNFKNQNKNIFLGKSRIWELIMRKIEDISPMLYRIYGNLLIFFNENLP